jgi:geranylgeranyl reductase family protein
MDTCDVLIVGGGPAGSTCAWKLHQAGLDVLVLDKASFPRDKICAGWITPQVVTELELDAADYRRGRTLQPVTGFRIGVIDEPQTTTVTYDRPISFGIRRCEFDEYLLRRSGARLRLSAPVTSIRRDGSRWIVNDEVSASILVGAGGHFCPVARWLNATIDRSAIVSAEEEEFAVASKPCAVVPAIPELYFSRDLTGYGWCFRKGPYLNVGFGHIQGRALHRETQQFTGFLRQAGRIPDDRPSRSRGHAYLLSQRRSRRIVGDGVLLIGDAAGVAYSLSGEGIGPAVESGLLAADAIHRAHGASSAESLHAYDTKMRERLGVGVSSRLGSRAIPTRAIVGAVRRLLHTRWFTQRVVLDRWFLHRGQPPLHDGSMNREIENDRDEDIDRLAAEPPRLERPLPDCGDRATVETGIERSHHTDS